MSSKFLDSKSPSPDAPDLGWLEAEFRRLDLHQVRNEEREREIICKSHFQAGQALSVLTYFCLKVECLPARFTLKPCVTSAKLMDEAHRMIEKLMEHLFDTLHQQTAQLSPWHWPSQPHPTDHSIRGEGSWQIEAINGVTGEGHMKGRERTRTGRCIIWRWIYHFGES